MSVSIKNVDTINYWTDTVILILTAAESPSNYHFCVCMSSQPSALPLSSAAAFFFFFRQTEELIINFYLVARRWTGEQTWNRLNSIRCRHECLEESCRMVSKAVCCLYLMRRASDSWTSFVCFPTAISLTSLPFNCRFKIQIFSIPS